ncbi:MAG TPA: hypothetical protein DCQ04_04020 [Actinobacteria bacterium]|nr:hypothetical protein [Actinomycetota bacterium]
MDAGLTARLVQCALSGRYGFKPSEIFVNDHPSGKSIPEYHTKLMRRIEAGSVELLDATMGGADTLPVFHISVSGNSGASCITKVRLPYSPTEVDPEFVQRVRQVAQCLIEDTCAEFLRGHDFDEWGRLHRERKGRRLFVPSQVDGAYWLTYLCGDYVTRLGGEAKFTVAPVASCSRVSDGVLLQSHASFVGLDQGPHKGGLDSLHNYLASLVKPEDRP